jgi:hypothetical protein
MITPAGIMRISLGVQPPSVVIAALSASHSPGADAD